MFSRKQRMFMKVKKGKKKRKKTIKPVKKKETNTREKPMEEKEKKKRNVRFLKSTRNLLVPATDGALASLRFLMGRPIFLY